MLAAPIKCITAEINTIIVVLKRMFMKPIQQNAAKNVTPTSLTFSGIISTITVNVSVRRPNDPKKEARSVVISGIQSIIVSVSE